MILIRWGILTWLLYSVASSNISAQKVTENRIFLKDGSIIYGEILRDDDYAVQILLTSGDTLLIGYKYIKSVGLENEVLKETRKKSYLMDKIHKYEGYFIQAEAGVVWSRNEDSAGQVFLNAGWRLTKKFNVGAGAGYVEMPKCLQHIWIEPSFVPIYAYSRFFFNDNTLRIFSSAKVGYGISAGEGGFFQFGTSHEYSGGLFSQIGAGIQVANRKAVKAMLQLNLTLQDSNGHYESRDFNGQLIVSDYSISYFRPGMTVGIEF